MATLPESATWEAGIYQLETTDPVQGGPEGIDNRQAKELANRSVYLKDALDALAAAMGELGISDISGLVDALNGKLSSGGGILSGDIELRNGTSDTPSVLWKDAENDTFVHMDVASEQLRIFGKYRNEAKYQHFMTLNIDTGRVSWVGAHVIDGILDVSGETYLKPNDAGQTYLSLLSDQHDIIGLRDGDNLTRWQLQKNPKTSGSHLQVVRYNSAGEYQDIPLAIDNASGDVAIANDLLIGGASLGPNAVRLPDGVIMQTIHYTIPAGGLSQLPTLTLPVALTSHVISVSAHLLLAKTGFQTHGFVFETVNPLDINDVAVYDPLTQLRITAVSGSGDFHEEQVVQITVIGK